MTGLINPITPMEVHAFVVGGLIALILYGMWLYTNRKVALGFVSGVLVASLMRLTSTANAVMNEVWYFSAPMAVVLLFVIGRKIYRSRCG